MATLVAACYSGYVPAIPALVVSPKPGTKAVARAESFQQDLGSPIRCAIVERPKSDDYGSRLTRVLEEAEIDVVCLAGFMFLLPGQVVRKYEGRVLNIHPALLPKFGGKGMYGLTVHEAVIAAGETESGCSVHLVNEAYDEGEIVLQKRCPVLPDDTPSSLADRVLDLEHEAYPEALKMVVERL